jgi:hypothetical protein
MYSAKVHSWMETLLAGMLRPAQAEAPGASVDGAALAVPTRPAKRSADRAATSIARSVVRGLFDTLIDTPRVMSRRTSSPQRGRCSNGLCTAAQQRADRRFPRAGPEHGHLMDDS